MNPRLVKRRKLQVELVWKEHHKFSLGHFKSEISTGHASENAELVVIYLSLEFTEESIALHNPVSSTVTFQGEIGASLNSLSFSLSITNGSEVYDNILLSEKSKL